MIIDNENCFTTGVSTVVLPNTLPSQAFPQAIGTQALANVIDSGPLGGQNTQAIIQNTGRDFGMGYPAWLWVVFLNALTSGGAATVDLQLVSSASPLLTAPVVMLDITGGPLAFNAPALGANHAYRIALPRAGMNTANNPTGWLRYIGLNAIVAGAALTAGTIAAFLTLTGGQDSTVYQSGFIVN
jgi:hypothetical protein